MANQNHTNASGGQTIVSLVSKAADAAAKAADAATKAAKLLKKKKR